MSTAIPRVLSPLTMADAMLTACSIAEPAASETAWVSGGTYALGDERIRTTTHRVYRALAAHSGVTTPPESDLTRWQELRPTLRWAPFDQYVSTGASTVTTLSYTFQPGFFNALALYGLVGATVDVVLRDAPAGAVLSAQSFSLIEECLDEYDYCWGPIKTLDRIVIADLLPVPTAELSLTVTASSGSAVGVGMIVLGDLRPLVLSAMGGTLYGATVEPKTYSYIVTNEFGETTIRRRHAGTNMSIEVMVPQADADYALRCLQEVLDVPSAWIATDAAGYASYNVFGLASGVRRADNAAMSTFSITVKGMI